MQHSFKNICYSADELLDGVTKLSTFMSKLKAQSTQNPDMHQPDDYFGAGFEALVEVIINQMGTAPFIQLKDYTPVETGDMGVDGFGYGPKGETHTVQVKARSNTDSVLTANRDHISNFVAHSLAKYDAKSMTIITTAKGLHEVVSSEMYQDKVRVINNEQLRSLLDDNRMFWTVLREQLKFS